MWWVWSVFAFLLAGSASAEAAETASAVVAAGREYFLTYCAACHGTDARGDGPAAASLVEPPSDLTRIAARRNGRFFMPELAATIDGRTVVAAHGSREMPVWGERFAEEYPDDGQQAEIVRGKIMTLLVYLQSIQR